jgi:hypothetical protein
MVTTATVVMKFSADDGRFAPKSELALSGSEVERHARVIAESS